MIDDDARYRYETKRSQNPQVLRKKSEELYLRVGSADDKRIFINLYSYEGFKCPRASHSIESW